MTTYKKDAYKYLERAEKAYPSGDLKLWETEYRGYILYRASDENYHWAIKTQEGEIPPVPLQSRFTGLERAKKTVDDYINALSKIALHEYMSKAREK